MNTFAYVSLLDNSKIVSNNSSVTYSEEKQSPGGVL